MFSLLYFQKKKNQDLLLFQNKYFVTKKRSKRNYTLTTIVFGLLGEGVGQNGHAQNFETLVSFIIYIDGVFCERLLVKNTIKMDQNAILHMVLNIFLKFSSAFDWKFFSRLLKIRDFNNKATFYFYLLPISIKKGKGGRKRQKQFSGRHNIFICYHTMMGFHCIPSKESFQNCCSRFFFNLLRHLNWSVYKNGRLSMRQPYTINRQN